MGRVRASAETQRTADLPQSARRPGAVARPAVAAGPQSLAATVARFFPKARWLARPRTNLAITRCGSIPSKWHPALIAKSAWIRELGCVRRVNEEADRLGLRTKCRTPMNGMEQGGKPFSRGHLYRLLSNRSNTGQMAHKGELYPGQHSRGWIPPSV